MRIIKCSLAAAMAVSIVGSSLSAGEFSDAFKNGKINGALQAYYFDQSRGGTSAAILNTGIDLSYKTAKYHGFTFKATVETSDSLYTDGDTLSGKPGFKIDMEGSGASLSESYLQYTADKTTAKVGRMYMRTPLFAGSPSRMNMEAFEGAWVVNNSIADTTLMVAYVQKFKGRTDFNGNIGEFTENVAVSIDHLRSGSTPHYTMNLVNGAYQVAVINKSIPGVKITAAYADVVDMVKIAYGEVAYKNTINGLRYGAGAQYYYNGYEAGEVTGMLGVKATLGMGAFDFMTAFNKTGADQDVIMGLGNGAYLAYTGSPIYSWPATKDSESYMASLRYKITDNASMMIGYYNDYWEFKKEIDYNFIGGRYECTGDLKGLGFVAHYEAQGKDSDDAFFRFRTNYRF
ncbi:MAG: imipenem/basic amino acid-specific outer membrane pore [Sulfurimonas sp.]|jgi:imipenem/basic amino acid-specific outer membrane pore